MCLWIFHNWNKWMPREVCGYAGQYRQCLRCGEERVRQIEFIRWI